MTRLLLALILLAGCKSETNEELAARYAREDAAEARRSIAARSPSNQAAATCQAKVQFAMAGWRPYSVWDVEGEVRRQQLHAACIDHWQRTGTFP